MPIALVRFSPAALHRVLLPAWCVLFAAGCGRSGGGGTLSAKWTTFERSGKAADTAKVARPHSFSGPVVSRWCAGAQRLEVTAVDEDLGFGLVLYPADSLRAGRYPAFDPGIDSVRRPSAAGAARIFTEQRLLGMQSDSGALELAASGPGYRARFGFRMRSLEGGDTIRVTGEAGGITAGRCPGDSVPSTAPRQ